MCPLKLKTKGRQSFSSTSTRSELPPHLPTKHLASHNTAEAGAGPVKAAMLLSEAGVSSSPHLMMKLELRPADPLSHLPKAAVKAQRDTDAEHKHSQKSFT